MPLNPNAVGSITGPSEFSWTSKDALLYAVSIGAGVDELVFTTENTEGVTQRTFPTLAVVLASGGFGSIDAVGPFDRTMMVHGEQSVTLHREIPVEGTATMTSVLTDMFDKGKAAIIVTSAEAVMDGEPLYTMRSATFIRGAGGWGGDRGPSGPRNVAPERAPDREITYVTSPDQALLYRLNADRHPLHSDPNFAKAGGFDRPIFHGLGTYGYTGRALLHLLCDSDPARFRHIEARFAAPVYPGESLTVRAWEVADGESVFTTSVRDRVVIDQGLVRYAS